MSMQSPRGHIEVLRGRGLETPRTLAVIGAALLLVVTTAGAGWVLREHELEDWRLDMGNLSLQLSESVAQTMASSYEVLNNMTDIVQAGMQGGDAGLAAATRTPQLYRSMRDKIMGLRQVEVVGIAGADGLSAAALWRGRSAAPRGR
jgi:hypothetical protein